MNAHSDHTIPLLPPELLENIILETWSSRLSTDHRITFMTDALLVNRMWKSLFVNISFRDVHIPCRSYEAQYLYTIAGYSSIFDQQSEAHPGTLCRSITVEIGKTEASAESVEGEGEPEEPLPGVNLFTLLYMLDKMAHRVPNLHTFCIEYENMGFDNLFYWWRFIPFPTQITNLEISFSYDQRMAALGEVLRATHERQHPQSRSMPDLPGVKNLVFSGASNALIADMAARCPNKESVTSLWPLAQPQFPVASSRHLQTL